MSGAITRWWAVAQTASRREPIRFIGAHVVRAAVAAKERVEIEGKKSEKLSVQLSKLAPAGLEDKG